MGNNFFNEYPYTDFHELNLSWVIKELRSFATTLEQFVSINALKYADPIQWDITTQYEKNTIVINPQSGTAYISVNAVPSGVSLNNTDYWTPVFDIGPLIIGAVKNLANIYEDSTTTTATVASSTGDWVVWGDTLYRSTTNIVPGDTYVIGSNIVKFTIEDAIGHLNELTTTNKNNIVAAINELVNSLATEVTDRQTTDTTLQNNIGAETTARQSADTTLQNNINAVQTQINTINKKIKKDIIIISDSYGVEGAPFVEHSFFYYLNNLLANSNADVTLHTIASRGAAFGGQHLDPLYMYVTYLESISASITDKAAITDIMIVGGYNDLLTYPMGGLVTDAETIQGIEAFKTYANNHYPNAKLHFVPIGSNTVAGSSAYYANYNIKFSWLVSNVIARGFAVNENAPYVIATKYYHASDNVHPSLEGQSEIANFLFNYIIGEYTHINRRHYFSEADVTAASGVTVSSLNMNVMQIDGIKHLAMSRCNFTCPSSTVSPSAWVDICTLPSDCIIDDMTRTQIYIKPMNVTYGLVLRINQGVLQVGALTQQTGFIGLDFRGCELTCDALQA